MLGPMEKPAVKMPESHFRVLVWIPISDPHLLLPTECRPWEAAVMNPWLGPCYP